MARLLYFANDTSDYHGGSWAVCQVLTRCARDAGWSVVAEGRKNSIEREAIESCDAVLINGEGTLHSNKPRARHLMSLLEFAQNAGKQTVLCNTSWFGMGDAYASIIRNLDYVSVREPQSARRMEAETGRAPELNIDLSFWQAATPASERATPVLRTDFYSREFDCFVDPNGGPMAALPRIDMRASSWEETVKAISGSKFLLTGRFHGLMVALKTKTPFIAFPGNTPKVEALLEWLGAEELVIRDFKNLARQVKSPRLYANRYADLFGRVDALKTWTFPL